MYSKIKYLFLIITSGIFIFNSAVAELLFAAEPLPKTWKHHLIINDEWNSNCPVSLNRLDLLTITYYGFDGKTHKGNLILFDAVAPFALNAFREMYKMHYPLEKVAQDGGLVTYEQTSAFDCRSIVGETNYSMHAYGAAIDINVMRNPYLGEFKMDINGNMSGQLIPPTSSSFSYLNRAIKRPGMNEQIVKLMAHAGFIRWGGQWQDRVDYQHFEVPLNVVENLIYLDRKSADQFMQLVIRYPDSAKNLSENSNWEYLYKLYPSSFMQAFAEYFPRLSSENEKVVFNLVYQKLFSNAKHAVHPDDGIK